MTTPPKRYAVAVQPSAEVSFTAGRSPVPLISAMEAAAATRRGVLAPRAAVGLAWRRAAMRCAGATREAETEAIVCTVEGATGNG